VKLLFDENLSPKLVDALADLYPQSAHVDRIGLGGASDTEVWEYAKQHGFTLASKDSDFHERSVLIGYPPKVVWIRRGNCSNRQIELILRNKVADIRALVESPELSYLIIL
jgi:predicted nuclease of predicted toxin-antitoxin system